MAGLRTQIFGIDFSGARTPSKSIWITEAEQSTDKLDVINCYSAAERFDLASNTSRKAVYEHLKRLIETHTTAIFGFDFPFSLPAPVINDVETWREHLDTFNERFSSDSTETFRQACLARAKEETGESAYLRRETDWRYGGQCPYQHQIQAQTFFGQRDLLRPLITNDRAIALPLQEQTTDQPWLIEVYPAATLGVLRLYRQGYKNHTASSKRRIRNLKGLRKHGINIPDDLTATCRQSDDALDSITAAVGTFHAVTEESPSTEYEATLEGQIFA